METLEGILIKGLKKDKTYRDGVRKSKKTNSLYLYVNDIPEISVYRNNKKDILKAMKRHFKTILSRDKSNWDKKESVVYLTIEAFTCIYYRIYFNGNKKASFKRIFQKQRPTSTY